MPPNKRPLIIGITGSIGSGKSSVSNIIRTTYPVLSSDHLAHQALENQNILSILTKRWGNSIIKDNYPDRQAIARIVFENKDELDYLNSVLHPIVLKTMQDIVNKATESVIIFEVPLLFEADLSKCFDFIILVTASESNRMSRIKERDKLSTKDILVRFKAQFDDIVKAESSDLVISNNGTIEMLKEKVDSLLNKISYLPYKEIIPFSQI